MMKPQIVILLTHTMLLHKYQYLIQDTFGLNVMIINLLSIINLKNVILKIGSPAENMEENIAVLPISYLQIYQDIIRIHMERLRLIYCSL